MPAEQQHRGIHARFAVGFPEADDCIEETIRRAAAPEHIVVVSSDHRLQRAARHRHCQSLSSAEYLESIESRRQRPRDASERDKPDRLSAEETSQWLREFADLEKDPGLKELFDPFDFEKDLE